MPTADYQAGMWIPGRDRESTSQLSTHLAAGTLSLQLAFVETAKAERAWHKANPGQYKTIPIGYGHEPWRHADSPLSLPLVDHKAALKTARANWESRESLLKPPTSIEAS